MSHPFKRIETEQLTGYEALNAVQRGEAESVSRFQEDHHSRQVAALAPTPDLAKIKSAKEKLARQSEELDAKETEQLNLVAQWNRKVTALETAQRRLSHGIAQFQSFENEVPGRLEFIGTNGWGETFGPYSQPAGILSLYVQVAGVKLLNEDFPRWRAAREAEIAVLTADLESFAKEHKITFGK